MNGLLTLTVFSLANASKVSWLQQTKLYSFIQRTHYDEAADIPLNQATMVRLGFHSCFGPNGCQGCITPSSKDPNNAGLDKTILDLYAGWKNSQYWKEGIIDISFADYLNVACLKAVENLTENTSIRSLTTYGRRDCPEIAINNSPFYESYDAGLPDATLSWDHVYEKFHTENFQFNPKEIVALIGGGHSVGQLSILNSGFPSGPWVDTSSQIDARFFQVLLNQKWTRNTTIPSRPVWTTFIGDRRLVMLNTDMSFYYDMDLVAENLDVSDDCERDARNCGFNLETMFYVQMFAEPSYHQEFVKTFIETYVKMLSSGPRAALKMVGPETEDENSDLAPKIEISPLGDSGSELKSSFVIALVIALSANLY